MIVYNFGDNSALLDSLHSVFNYNIRDLSEGFYYLDFFLKIDRYATNDWLWLVQKYEKRIKNWCTRWLTLRGRLVLIKVVLECQLVYWLTLATLRAAIQNKIYQITYNFLWSGNKEKKKYHLCNWQMIGRPKLLGGWGLRSLTGFSRVLAAHSLWRVVLNGGLWQ